MSELTDFLFAAIAEDERRALAECDAKRKLVEGLAAVVGGTYIDDGELPQAEWALSLLAQPYVDREGYRPEWRPE